MIGLVSLKLSLISSFHLPREIGFILVVGEGRGGVHSLALWMPMSRGVEAWARLLWYLQHLDWEQCHWSLFQCLLLLFRQQWEANVLFHILFHVLWSLHYHYIPPYWSFYVLLTASLHGDTSFNFGPDPTNETHALSLSRLLILLLRPDELPWGQAWCWNPAYLT